MPQTVPTDTALRQFLLGALPPAEAAVVERWLEADPEASVRLRGLSAHDTVTDAIGIEANTTDGGTAVGTHPPKNPGGVPVAVGGYRVLRELGRGGMGVVLEAEDGHLKRRVAIKLIAAECASSRPARDRFLREAQAVARVDHPNVVPVHHVGEHDGQLYLVMPLLKGETLDARLRREKRLTAAEVMRVGREVAAGLAAAHAVGLIHRDVKPANIWLDADTGRARVLDFGLAKPLDEAADGEPLTDTGAVLGTLHYMSPQQANGEPLDPRTDLFSLGAVLHHAATGERPFDGPTKFAVLYAVVNDTPKNLHALAAALPARVSEVVRELLEKRPDARPRSAAEVVERLIELPVVVSPSLAVSTPDASPWEALTDEPDDEEDDTEAVRPPARARPRLWAPAAVAAVLLLVLGVVAVAVVIIRDKNGKEIARIEVPDGGSVEVKPNTAAPPPRPANNADRKAAVAVLTAGGTVGVDGDRADITRVGKLPARPFKLTRVVVPATASATDAALAPLAVCADLGEVQLRQPRLTDAALVHIKGSKALKTLWLSGPGFTDAGLAHLGERPDLSGVLLDDTAVTAAGLARLAGRASLSYLRLTGPRVADEWLKPFRAHNALTYLCLSSPHVTDAGLANLASAKLIEVDLGGTSVTDAGLATFKGCGELRSLTLAGTSVTDAGLAHLDGCTQLQDVSLNRTRVTDAALARLAKIKSLKTLWLNGTSVTDAGLARLADSSRLEFLDLRETKVTAKGTKAISEALPNCRIEWDGGAIDPTASDRKAAEWVLSIGGKVVLSVDGQSKSCLAAKDLPNGPYIVIEIDLLQNAKITAEGITNLKGLGNLKSLALHDTAVKDADLAHLAGLTTLESLQVGKTNVTSAGLVHLKGLTALQQLSLQETDVDDGAVEHLLALESLKKLALAGTKMTAPGLARLGAMNLTSLTTGPEFRAEVAQQHKALQYLSLQHLKGDNPELEWLKSLSDLRQLDLYRSNAGDAALRHVNALPKLYYLRLRGTNVTDAGLAQLKSHPALQRLDLSFTKVTNASVAHLKTLTQLTELDLSDTEVKATGIKELQESLPNCKVVWDGTAEPKK